MFPTLLKRLQGVLLSCLVIDQFDRWKQGYEESDGLEIASPELRVAYHQEVARLLEIDPRDFAVEVNQEDVELLEFGFRIVRDYAKTDEFVRAMDREFGE